LTKQLFNAKKKHRKNKQTKT